MKRGVVSEAMNMIPEEYKLKALEVLNQAEVSEITNMKKRSMRRTLTVAVAATMTLALGTVVAAKTGLFGMTMREPAPSEKTITESYVFHDEETGEDELYVIQKDVTAVIDFDGQTECQGIEFKLNYLPSMTTIPGGEFGDPNGWNEDMLQFETENGSVTVMTYYDAQFGQDGIYYFDEDLYNVERLTMGEYDVYKLSSAYSLDYEYSVEQDCFTEENPEENLEENLEENPEEINCIITTDYTYNYIIMHHPDGYILVIGGSESMDVLTEVAQNIEVQHTDKVFQSTEFTAQNIEAYNGVG